MARFERITDRELLQQYALATESQLGILFPIEYLERSLVFACMDAGRRGFEGGFVIVPDAPFRVIESLAEEVRRAHPFFKTVPDRKICELTALWLTPQARKKGYSFPFWVRAYYEMLKSGKSHFVYAYALHKTHLQRIFGTAQPQVLFRGETRMLPGMSAPEEESVEAIRIWTMALVPLLKPRFFLGRLRMNPKPLKKAVTKEA